MKIGVSLEIFFAEINDIGLYLRELLETLMAVFLVFAGAR